MSFELVQALIDIGRWHMEGEISVDTRFLEIAQREEAKSGLDISDI